jgi:peptidoglycan/LPS O-acetylase OafA/YrhL
MNGEYEPRDAEQALAEIRGRQEQVIGTALVPGWYWWALAVLMVGLGTGVDERESFPIGVAVVAFVAGVLAATAWATRSALNFRLRNDLLGISGVPAILGLVACVIAVALGAAFALRAAHEPLPGTVGTALGGLVLIAGGPLLMRTLHGIMSRHAPGA